MDHAFEARLFGSHLVLQTPGFGRILIFDRAEGAVLQEWSDLPSGNLLMDAMLTEDGRFIVQMNSDGSFHIHRVADGTTVLSGRIVDDEIAVWTEDYRFDATAEAASRIDLRFPGLSGQFSLDRFDAALHAPDLVELVLSGEVPSAPPMPVPPDLSGTIVATDGRIEAVAALDPTRGARELRLYQDGVLTRTAAIEVGAVEARIDVPRLPGTRHASLLAVGPDGIASLPVTRDLGPELPGGTRRALAVAIDRYQDPGLSDLNYAKADADRFMRLMAGLPDDVPAFEPASFVGGRRAGPQDALEAIDALLDGLTAADHAVLFFAGHGVQDAEGRFYLAMSQTDLTDLPGTALAWEDVAARLADAEARITVLMDACHSGSAGIGGFATNDGAVAGLSSVPSNLTVLAASKGRQQSIEARSLEGGLFTVALERVLVGERSLHDANGNGRIEASELAEGLRRIVSGQSEGRQVPWMTKGRIVGDHALF
ncbi:MAG: caspase family protein [Pseudomonadota bacterium]